MITLVPLAGSSSSLTPTAESPACYLLEIDEVRILLDCGGYDPRAGLDRSYEYEERIRELAPTVSLVLLSHSPATYLSLYPYARAHWGLRCPVYATQPTVEMGRVVCLEEALNWRAEVKVEDELEAKGVGAGALPLENGRPEEADETESSSNPTQRPFKPPFICTADQINEAFNWIKPVRYSQPIHLPGTLSHILLTPYASAHTLGGSLFKLRSPTSGTILYAVGINHQGERCLDGTVLLGGRLGMAEGLQRPDLLITEGSRSLYKGAKQKDRAEALLSLITKTLQSRRSLLFPVDAGPRLLELLVLLDQHWSYQTTQPGGWPFPLCLVSRTGEEMLAFARSLMEWMGGSVAADEGLASGGGGGRGRKRPREGKSPLAFRHLRFYPTAEALQSAMPSDQPKLVLAVPLTLAYGPSRRLFTSIAATEGNVVVLTGRTVTSTLANELFERWNGEQADSDKFGHGGVGQTRPLSGQLDVQIDSKVPLEGEELAAFEEEQRLANEREAARKAAQERSRRMLEADDLEEDSDSDDDDAEQVGNLLSSLAEGGLSGDLQATNGAGGNAFLDADDIRTTSFDIYVKGQQTRTTAFFRSSNAYASQTQARFRMFPFVERGGRGRKVDVYGETLDVGAWLRKGREIEEEIESDEVKEAKRRKKEEEEKKKEPPEPPSKFVSETVAVPLRCSLLFIDMEGQHDGRAIKTIIPSLHPRRIALVRSYPEATADLRSTLDTLPGMTKEVFCPGIGETVTIGEHTNSFSVALSETVLAGLNGKAGWSKFEDYEIAQVSGRIASTADSSVPVLDAGGKAPRVARPAVKPETQAEAPSAAPTTAALGDVDAMAGGHPTVKTEESAVEPGSKPRRTLAHRATRPALPLPTSLFIGDLRLLALKAHLASLGIPAEFAGEGVLVCGRGVPALLAAASGDKASPDDAAAAAEVVAVRKAADGVVWVEGAVNEEYYRVRDAVYGSFAQVTVA